MVTARRTKALLSHERILAAATALADAEGISAVTMRRVSERLECEAMSLYHYVADKRSLLDGLVGTVIGEVVSVAAAIPDSDDWREAVRGRCLAARQVMLRHPWAPALTATSNTVPPESMELYEQFVGTLVSAEFSYDLAHRAIHALGSMVLGFSNELFEPAGSAPQEPTAEELAAMSQRMPHLARLAAMDVHDADGALSVCDTQAEFEFTLGLVLDGLEAARLARSHAHQAP
ncbi:MAG: TetR/AcrR family transcriptional regulator C-terminal domain-containing protein [Actinomycetales bacterium]|nr:TetR/AcrR family transcriptional regulator C-terminal domain-containing protein [Actinomycetales bacterium]